MIQDLTKVGIKSIDRRLYIRHIDLFDVEQEDCSYKSCRALILTGTAIQRAVKRQTALHYEYQCECCGRFYIARPWSITWGLCDECYAREYQQEPTTWRFKAVNRTWQILDLWNRCY